MSASTTVRRRVVITGVGAAVKGFASGDRVTFDSTVFCGECVHCRRGDVNLCDNRQVLGVSCGDYRRHGAFAEFVTVPARILHKLPAELGFAEAAMIEAVSVGVHAVRLTPVAPGDTAVVVGTGMIGLLTLQAAKIAGFAQVIAGIGRIGLIAAGGRDGVGQGASTFTDLDRAIERQRHGGGRLLVQGGHRGVRRRLLGLCALQGGAHPPGCGCRSTSQQPDRLRPRMTFLDRLAAVPFIAILRHLHHGNLIAMPLPLPEALYVQLEIAFILLWHKRHNQDAKVMWLRGEIRRLYGLAAAGMTRFAWGGPMGSGAVKEKQGGGGSPV